MKNQELATHLESLSTTHFCDASSKVRIFDPGIHNLTNNSRIIGKAFTVETNGDLLPVMQAIEFAEPGDVLVIASNGKKIALAGEIFSTAALQRGLVGMILDGYCRDIDAIRKLNFPFYAKGTYPAAGTKHKFGQLNVPIVCGDILIHPQDIIFGDDSGLIAMTEAEFISVLPIANEIREKETKALAKLQQGQTLQDIFNLTDHVEDLLQEKFSTLSWL